MDAQRLFWEEHPALLFALSFLTGIAAFLFWEGSCKLLFPLLFALYLLFLKRTSLLLLIAAGYLYSWCLYGDLPHPSEPLFTRARYHIQSLQPHSTPFQKGYLFKGTLHLPKCTLPCSIFYPGKNPPKASCDYLLTGTLSQRAPFQYSFRPKQWTPLKKSWGLALFRFEMKERLRHFLTQRVSHTRVLSFFSSLATGDVDDRQLRYEFGRLGLQHLLAISGFHFGILIAFCSALLSLFLPHTARLLLLSLAITAYFFFIGSNPAVQRSWLVAELYFLAKLFKRVPNGLNLLGAALLAELILDPLRATQLGFCLSFLSCAGILLLFPLFERALRLPFPKRTNQEIAALSLPSKHGYLLSAFFRQSFALAYAVNLTLLPVLLYHFHTFPLLSFLYNLFFPLLVGAALSLLLLAILFHFLFFPLGNLLFFLTDSFTSHLLDLTSYPPFVLDYALRTDAIASWMLPLYFFALLLLSIQLRASFCEKSQPYIL